MTAVSDLLDGLRGLRAYRITEIPRSDVPSAGDGRQQDSDPDRPQRAAALTAAYHVDGVIAFGWIRIAEGGPVHVVVAGDALVGSRIPASTATGGDVLLSLPGGARGTVLTPADVTGLLGGIGCWRNVAGISDGLLTPPGERSTRAGGAQSVESRLLRSWTGPFGWMVVATPLAAGDLRALADDAAKHLHLAEAAADRFPERAVAARRLNARHAELRQGFSSGFWSIRVMAGGMDEASAVRVNGLFCASAELDGLPYRLVPAPDGDAAAQTAEKRARAPESIPSSDDTVALSPFLGSTEVLAALARPPESEVPGVRLALRPEFDVTPEAAPGPGVTIGDVLDRDLMPAGPFSVTLDSLNRHVFVCGATGAGKSQTVRTLLEAATARGINWLVVEPAKAEYRLMANRLPGTAVVRIRPGEADAVAAGLNPLEPAVTETGERFPLQTHADLIRALFIASFRSEEPFPQVLSAALTRVYEEAGWDLALGEARGFAGASYPTLADLQRAAERVVADIGYSQRVTDDVLGFIRVRIASLRAGTTGRFLEGGHPVDFARLLRQNVVLEIEDVGDDRDKAFLMGTVLIRLTEHLRLAHAGMMASTSRSGSTGGSTGNRQHLTHLTVVEEAHRLLRRAEPGDQAGAGAHAVEMFAGLLAEIRAYGEGLIVAEQIPARITVDVIKNTAIKITHRLPAADDRDTVGATMNVTPAQSRYLVTLPPGQAAAFTDGMDFPVLVKIKDRTERELAAPPSTHSPQSVVTPRSVTCGGECATRPCTLREMRAAQRLLDDDLPGDGRWVRRWAELAVLAHLAGWPAPVPKPSRLASFAALPPRVAQCAVSHAVDSAVAVRVPAFAGRVDPAGLATHVCAVIRADAERGSGPGSPEEPCAPEEPRWRLPGPVTEAVVYGVSRPSALESSGPREGFLDDFVDCQWPLAYLAARGSDGYGAVTATRQ
jgi:DNA helicase HerA-like ATPase